MQEHERTNRIYSYFIYSASALMLMTAIALYNWVFLLLSAFMLLVSVAYLHTGHMINNYLIRRSKVIEIYNGYKLGQDLGYVTKRVGAAYRGVAVAILEPDRKLEGKDISITNLLETIKDPFEFAIALKQIDKKALVEPLETKRRMKEIELSRASAASYAKINKLKREMELLESEINHLVKSGNSFEILVRIKATTVSESEIEAGKEAARSLDSIAGKFAATFGVDYEILKGERLLNELEMG
ncbi:MAG: hypothetical protein KGH72_05415 [Candidatus Micrarchaeota archaeon]|nr:hypothetical protein [Candidatus Micrarchaeota archaeon]